MSIAAARDILRRLVGFATVSSSSNLPLVEWVTAYLGKLGIEATLLPSPDGRKANLWASVGPDVPGGIVLSGHTDVVPVEGQRWSSDPFTLTERDGRLFGRGTADMKGFIALALAAVPRYLRADLRTPIHLALSYDEELGCLGVTPLVEHLAARARPSLAFVGEPTSMRVVDAHKGYRAFRTRLEGRAAHSSLPGLGLSAIKLAGAFIAALGDVELALAERGARGPARLVPPYTTLNIGTIHGGLAVNIVPSEVVIEWEFRPVPGEDPEAVVAFVDDRLTHHLPPEVTPELARTLVETVQIAAEPVLEPRPGNPAEALALALTGGGACEARSFGTEAGFFQAAGIHTVVVGPGDVAQAHQPDEFVTLDQLEAGMRFLDALGRFAAGERPDGGPGLA